MNRAPILLPGWTVIFDYELFPARPLGDFFAACYVSGELNLLKPNAEIYQHVLDDLGISAAEAVFTDNREANIRGAEALGITGHLFTDVAALRAFLALLT